MNLLLDCLVALILALETFLLRKEIKAFGLSPTPTIIQGSIIGFQLVLAGCYSGLINYLFLYSYSKGGVISEYYVSQVIYFLIFMFVYLSYLYMARDSKQNKPSNPHATAPVLLSSSWFVVLVIVLLMVVFVVNANLSIAWVNQQYLAMTDPGTVLEPGAVRSIVLIPAIVGILGGAFAALHIAYGGYLWGSVYVSLSAMSFVYLLGAHSRTAAFAPIVFLMVLKTFSTRSRPVTTIIAAVAIVYSLWSALVGRSYPSHGISTVLTLPANVDSGSSLFDVLLPNFFEGSLVLAESLTLRPTYPVIYQILSILPTPSVIDGFDLLKSQYEVRLSFFAPMSGIVEAINFGPLYVLAILAIFWIAFKLSEMLRGVSQFAFSISTSLILLGFYVLNAYPLRNGLRWVWLSILVSTVVVLSHRFRLSGRTPSRGRVHQPGAYAARRLVTHEGRDDTYI